MQRVLSYLGAGLLVLLAVVLVRSQRGARLLEAQLREAHADHHRLADERKALDRRVLMLTEEQEADRHLIGQLWRLIQEDRPPSGAQTAGRPPSSYDLTRLKAMVQASGGSLDAVVREVLPPERLDATLQRHATQPAFWVAAASMCADRHQAMQYLEAAAARFPDSAIAQAALIEAKKGLTSTDPATRAAIHNLRQADPTSSLADHYDAFFRFKEGDLAGGLQALGAASEKGRFADHRMELMMSRYECLRENGCSDGGALALSAFSLSFEPLPMLREVSQRALQQAQAAFAAGQFEQAVQTAEYVARVGRNLSASGRFLVYDRVGMELQQTALEAQREFQQAANDTFQAGEIDFQLGAIQERAAQVNALAGAFGGMLASMTDDDIVRYIESAIMHGEFATLQRLIPAP